MIKYMFEVEEEIESCTDCPCYNDDCGCCDLNNFIYTMFDGIPMECPLVKVEEK